MVYTVGITGVEEGGYRLGGMRENGKINIKHDCRLFSAFAKKATVLF